MVQSDGQLAAVLLLWRQEDGEAFYEEDEEIAYSYLVWGGIALHYAQLYFSMNQQRKLNDFLLAVVKYEIILIEIEFYFNKNVRISDRYFKIWLVWICS